MLNKVIFKGFKSFANEQIMNFDDGINGIIGPNGCGKSNIIDGISFVLGAQSAKNLRGGKMQDVIFAGSDKRKAKDEAEVTLILDNSKGTFKKIDTPEISVSRRVFRSGGSEYSINNEQAKFRDIIDLFMDTGVGSDSYSIIGQGQIGKILSTKLEERRAIFEEASGIVKLKQQKEQTEKRLKEVNNNMVRIEDIVKEIERQLKPLEKQSEKAKEYNNYNDELTKLEVQYLLNGLDSSSLHKEEEEKNIDSFKQKVDDISEKLDINEKDLTSLKEDFEEKNNSLFDLQKEYTLLKEEYEKINGSLMLNQERINNSNNQIEEGKKNLKEIESEYSLSTEEFKGKQDRINIITFELSEKENKIKSLEEKIIDIEKNLIFKNTDIEHQRKQSVEKYNSINKKKYEHEQTEKEIKQLENEMKENSNQTDTYQKENNELERALKKAEEKYKSSKAENTKIQERLKEIEEKIKNKRERFDNNISLKQKTEGSFFSLKSKVENIESFIDNNEGFYDGVKSILQEKKNGKFSGVLGAVAEVIKVEQEFEISVDSLLQSSMQFLVTEDDSVAKEAINFLKKEKKGRATFLPLNLANHYTFDKKELELISHFEGVYLAADKIEHEQKFLPIVNSLLGRSIIAKNMDVALNFLKTNKIKAKISTLEGEIIQSGSMSGGQSKNKKINFFSKKRELEETKTELVKVEAMLKELENQDINLKNELASLEKELNTYSKFLEQNHASLNEEEKEMENISYNFERINERIKEKRIFEQESNLNLREMKKTIMNLKLDIEKEEKDYEENNNSLTDIQDTIEKLKDELENTKTEKTNFIMDITRLKEEEKQINSYLNDINDDNYTIEDKIKKIDSRIEDEKGRISELEEHGKDLEKQCSKLKENMLEYETNVENSRIENLNIQEQIKEMEKIINEERRIKEDTEKILNKHKIALNKCEIEMNNILNKLKDPYGFEETDIIEIKRVEINLEESKKRIAVLKKSINELGNINHAAIDEFAILEKRYKDEKEQLDDIKTAKDDLDGLIKSVEEEMITRFNSTFNSIAEKFSETFVEFFEGGKAKLILEEPNKPLTSAIEIVAQPPGKKPASINSLSGGEKSFTAVALIFAIISSKPSPFVILDEVDAPLDDANVIRFAKQLLRYRDMTQFVVITHRKGTMMACETITGITQEEKGVSIVFPHTLEDKEKLLS